MIGYTSAYIYLTGIIYYTLMMGHVRKTHPQIFAVDLMTTFLIFLWPVMILVSLFTRAKT